MNSIGANKTQIGETIDRGYHVYVVVLEASVEQILPCEREGGNIHDSYAAVVVENNEGVAQVIVTPWYSMKFSRLKLSRIPPKPRNPRKVFTRERYPLYGIYPIQ